VNALSDAIDVHEVTLETVRREAGCLGNYYMDTPLINQDNSGIHIGQERVRFKKPMKHYLKTAFILIISLVCFQMILSLRVFLSNTELAKIMVLANGNGYLAVPNALVGDRLHSLGMALAGGLFFTLSVGALVCLVSLGATCLYPVLSLGRKTKTIVFLCVPFLVILLVNQDGFLWLETLALVLIPVLIYFLYRFLFKGDLPVFSLKKVGFHALFPVILALVLLVFPKGTDNRIFSDFRDTFLMSNPFGMGINDFYYTYTLSPAEVFKSLDQKLIKKGAIELKSTQNHLRQRIEHELLAADYLILDHDENPDLTIRCEKDQLFFFHAKRLIHETRVHDFFNDPRSAFNAFSMGTDTYNGYRKLTGMALITGLPLLVYLSLHGFFFIIGCMFMGPSLSARMASGLCLALGLSAFVFMASLNPKSMDPATISADLCSDSPALRTNALHLIFDKKLDITQYPQSKAAMASTFVPERYWYARASANSQQKRNLTDLLDLLNDPHPNVQCQAFFALGKLGNRRAIPEMVRRIRSSDHWYVQWYAYKALKRLGWTQKKSNP